MAFLLNGVQKTLSRARWPDSGGASTGLAYCSTSKRRQIADAGLVLYPYAHGLGSHLRRHRGLDSGHAVDVGVLDLRRPHLSAAVSDGLYPAAGAPAARPAAAVEPAGPRGRPRRNRQLAFGERLSGFPGRCAARTCPGRKRVARLCRRPRRLSLPVPVGRHPSRAAAALRAHLRLPAAAHAAFVRRQRTAKRPEIRLLLGRDDRSRRLCCAAARVRPRQLLGSAPRGEASAASGEAMSVKAAFQTVSHAGLSPQNRLVDQRWQVLTAAAAGRLLAASVPFSFEERFRWLRSPLPECSSRF